MIKTYSNFDEFEADAKGAGVEQNLNELLWLDTLFVESYRDHLLINMKDYGAQPNNILVLSEEKNYWFSDKKLTERDLKLFRITLQKKFGESTVLVLLAVREVLANYQQKFDALKREINELDKTLNVEKITDVGHSLRKFIDRLDDMQDLLVRLEDRKINEFRTSYVEYDLDLLRAKARLLSDRAKRAVQDLAGLRNEAEFKATRELNSRLEKLNEIIKRLTAVTIILMVPNIIAGHFGMNFKYMPELNWEFGYPAAIIFSIVATLLTVFYFKRKGWL